MWTDPHISKENSVALGDAIGLILAFTRDMSVLELVHRLRTEFTAMPGLSLTVAQVARLCTADPFTSTSALRVLVSTGFVTPMPDGSHVRTDVWRTAPSRGGRRSPCASAGFILAYPHGRVDRPGFQKHGVVWASDRLGRSGLLAEFLIPGSLGKAES